MDVTFLGEWLTGHFRVDDKSKTSIGGQSKACDWLPDSAPGKSQLCAKRPSKRASCLRPIATAAASTPPRWWSEAGEVVDILKYPQKPPEADDGPAGDFPSDDTSSR